MPLKFSLKNGCIRRVMDWILFFWVNNAIWVIFSSNEKTCAHPEFVSRTIGVDRYGLGPILTLATWNICIPTQVKPMVIFPPTEQQGKNSQTWCWWSLFVWHQKQPWQLSIGHKVTSGRRSGNQVIWLKNSHFFFTSPLYLGVARFVPYKQSLLLYWLVTIKVFPTMLSNFKPMHCICIKHMHH